MMKHLFIIILFPVFGMAADKPLHTVRSNSTIIVENINDDGPGSLRQAIFQANSNPGEDIINFQPSLSGSILLNSRLPIIIESVIINGPGAEKMNISGQDQFRILETYNTTVAIEIRISGLTFRNGRGNAGAAIRNGGLSKLYLFNCTFKNNAAPNTGAGDGGALANFISARISIDKCSFFENMAATLGGAVYNLGFLEIMNSTFHSNKAFNGSAVYNINQTGIVNISNCTISGNITEGGSGGGIFADLSSTTYIKNSTITLNRTTGIGSGGGIFAGSASVYLSSSIIAENITKVNGPDIQGAVISSGFNLVGNTLNSTGITQGINNDLAGSSTLPLNPLLGPLQFNGGATLTHALLPGSPAIDAGTCNGMTVDQRGVARPYNGICDIGAFEVAPSIKANLGPLTVFLSAASPADNGKMIDVKADILVGDSAFGSQILLRKRIAGLQNQNGLRIDIPVTAPDVPVNPSDSIRIRVSIRSTDRHGMSASLWHNSDSTTRISRGFSRMIYSIDSSAPSFLYLSENFHLTTTPGTRAISAAATGTSDFATIGTWSIQVGQLTEQLRVRNAGRPVAQIPEISAKDFSVIPNPSGLSPVFQFENKDADQATLEITDATGKLVAVRQIRISGQVKTTFKGISLNRSGFYAARLTLEKGGRIIARETTRFLANQ